MFKFKRFLCTKHIVGAGDNHLFQRFFLFFVRNGAVYGAKKLF